jgi:thiamine-monophosphate kinase
MRVRELGEFGLIERIRKITPAGRGVRIGIGDDAAAVECKGRLVLFTTDHLIEGVHFDLRWAPFYAIGYKSVAVNLSDVAAMGGVPAYFVLSLGVPVDLDSRDIEEFYRGVRAIATRGRVALVGGDTNSAERFLVSVSVIGFAAKDPVRRGGGRPGDDLYITGTLGDAALGLKLLRKKKARRREDNALRYLKRRHLLPTPRVEVGAALAKAGLARAMIDVSDGLLQDLGHLCEESHMGAVLRLDALPLSRPYRRVVGARVPLEALSGGEDYELLFSARLRDRAKIDRLKAKFSVPVTRIGTCTPHEQGVRVVDGAGDPVLLPFVGFDHFRDRH